jgi:hypothetical protein
MVVCLFGFHLQRTYLQFITTPGHKPDYFLSRGVEEKIRCGKIVFKLVKCMAVENPIV